MGAAHPARDEQTKSRIFCGDTRAEGKSSAFRASTKHPQGKAEAHEFGKMVKLQEARKPRL